MKPGRERFEAYMKSAPKKVKEKARKAGSSILEKLRNVDDAYSAKIAQMYEGANPAVQAAAYMVGGGSPSLRKAQQERDIGPETRMQQLGRSAMEYAVPAANAVPKYVLPAAGTVMAGQALASLVDNQQTNATLDMN